MALKFFARIRPSSALLVVFVLVVILSLSALIDRDGATSLKINPEREAVSNRAREESNLSVGRGGEANDEPLIGDETETEEGGAINLIESDRPDQLTGREFKSFSNRTLGLAFQKPENWQFLGERTDSKKEDYLEIGIGSASQVGKPELLVYKNPGSLSFENFSVVVETEKSVRVGSVEGKVLVGEEPSETGRRAHFLRFSFETNDYVFLLSYSKTSNFSEDFDRIVESVVFL